MARNPETSSARNWPWRASFVQPQGLADRDSMAYRTPASRQRCRATDHQAGSPHHKRTGGSRLVGRALQRSTADRGPATTYPQRTRPRWPTGIRHSRGSRGLRRTLGRRALAACIEGQLLGNDLIDYFLDRDHRIADIRARLKQGARPSDALFWQE